MAKMTLCSKSPSGNEKIAEKGSKRVYATYRATTKRDKKTNELIHKTCPSNCALLTFCYANAGMSNIQQGNAEHRSDNVTEWIKSLPENSIVRHLVSGDLFLNDEVDNEYINESLEGHAARPDIRGYGYTHGWDRLEASQVNNETVTFNASCDNETQLQTVLNSGWDAVKIWDENDGIIKYTDTYKQVKCPNQTIGVTCEKCQLCARSNRRDKNDLPIVIAFEAHGTMRGRVKLAIAAAFDEGGDK